MTSVCFGYRLYAIVDIFWEILNEQQRKKKPEKGSTTDFFCRLLLELWLLQNHLPV